MKGLNSKNKKKNKDRVITILIILLLLFASFFYFISDNRNNIMLFSMLKDASASVYNVLNISKTDALDKNIASEINKDYENQIEEMKKTLNLNSTMSDKTFINASVIKRSTVYWYNLVTIDKGTKNGIKEGYAVINSSGLIGKVIKANKYTSDIKLITSKNEENYISAMFDIDGTLYYGLINEYDITKNELYLKNVVGDFDINKIKNVNVVTSGYSEAFSSGLLIGTIIDVKKENYGISNTIKIRPSANFNNINIVTVIKGDNND